MTEEYTPVTSDGLWKMARWEEATSDPLTLSVVVQRVAEGETLKEVCKSRGWPYSLVARWLAEDVGRKAQYDAALSLWGDGLAQEAVAIADASENDVSVDDEGRERVNADVIQRSKLRVDTRLKLASKWDRDRYGDKVLNAAPANPQGVMDAALEIVARGLLDKMRVVSTQLPEAIDAQS
jgi:hypothetical protein